MYSARWMASAVESARSGSWPRRAGSPNARRSATPPAIAAVRARAATDARSAGDRARHGEAGQRQERDGAVRAEECDGRARAGGGGLGHGSPRRRGPRGRDEEHRARRDRQREGGVERAREERGAGEEDEHRGRARRVEGLEAEALAEPRERPHGERRHQREPERAEQRPRARGAVLLGLRLRAGGVGRREQGAGQRRRRRAQRDRGAVPEHGAGRVRRRVLRGLREPRQQRRVGPQEGARVARVRGHRHAVVGRDGERLRARHHRAQRPFGLALEERYREAQPADRGRGEERHRPRARPGAPPAPAGGRNEGDERGGDEGGEHERPRGLRAPSPLPLRRVGRGPAQPGQRVGGERDEDTERDGREGRKRDRAPARGPAGRACAAAGRVFGLC